MGKIWLASACIVYGLAASASDAIVEYVEADAQSSIELAQSIWEFAELGYLEERSSSLLPRYLGERGFSIEARQIPR